MSTPEESILDVGSTSQATVIILGLPIEIEYTVVQFGQVKWALAYDNIRTPEERTWIRLMELLLRVHYTPFIETQLRDQWFREEYEDAMAGIGRDFEDIPF